MLAKHNLRYRLPEIVLGVNQIHGIMDEILDEMNYRCTPSHVACLLIGAANSSLGMSSAANSKYESEMKALALNRIKALDIMCEDLRINSTSLFDHMLETSFDGQSIRKLLKMLERPMVILFISADPWNAPRLGLGEEQRCLDEALRSQGSYDWRNQWD
ncbi:hypothetical protein PG987_013903 [Apiospora arundinis]